MTIESSRIALVTGAGSGIGRAVALRLSAEGCLVALTGRRESALDAVAAEVPGAALTVPADVTRPGDIDRIFATIEAHWGPVEVLVCTAGVGISSSFTQITDAEWQTTLDLNLTAPFRCSRRALPAMLEKGWGRVIVVASVAAKHGEPYIAAYTASKHGVLGMVRAAAAETAKKGVTFNAVCPAYVDTPMTDATIERIVTRTGRTAEQARGILEAKQPIGRLITPEEVAEAVWFCVVNAAITGQGINVDGGAVQS